VKNIRMALVMAATAAMLAACGGGGGNEGQNPGVSGTPPAADTLNRTNTPGVYANSARKYAFDTLNQVRGITGVGFLKQNEALDMAAQAHADYGRLAGLRPVDVEHTENPGHAGFTGKTPDERARYFGYTHGASEVLNGVDNVMQSFWMLLGVPYHSINMLDTYADIGVGVWPKAIMVMNLGNYFAQLLDGSFVAVYPCNDMQVNVQRQGYEIPLPSVLNGKQDFGYSSVALVRMGQTLDVSSWELRDASGNVVPTTLMTKANDANKMVLANQASLIPLNALPRTVTTYTSVLKGKNDGVPFEKTCTWRTVVGETVPSN